MVRISCLRLFLLLLALLLMNPGISGAEDYWANFSEALKAGNRTDALRWVELAYKENPSSKDRVLYYARELNYAKRHSEALSLLETLPPGFMGGWSAYELGDVYEKLGRTAEARVAYEAGIIAWPKNTDAGKYPAAGKFLASNLIDVLTKTNDVASLVRLQDDIFAAVGENLDGFNSQLIDVAMMYLITASSLYESGEEKEADAYVEKAEEIREKGLINQYGLGSEWCKAFDYCRRNLSPSGEYTEYRMLWIFYKRVHAKTAEGVLIDNRLTQEDIDRYIPAFDAARRMVFYLSNGKILLKRDVVVVDSEIRKLELFSFTDTVKNDGTREVFKNHRAVLTSAKPYPGELLFSNRNSYDAFVSVYPAKGIPGTYCCSSDPLEFIPGKLKANALRSQIFMPDFSENYGIRISYGLVHEIFHSIEAAFQKRYTFILHVWHEEKSKQWPEWYHGENGEMGYYMEAFRNVILPLGVERIRHADIPDTHSVDDFK